MQSLITLAKGDMRKALNILQVSNDNRMMIGVFIQVDKRAKGLTTIKKYSFT